MCEQIFQQLKMCHGEGGRFFKKTSMSGVLFEVDDAVARQSELYRDTPINVSLEIMSTSHMFFNWQKFCRILSGEWNQVASGWTRAASLTPRHP